MIKIVLGRKIILTVAIAILAALLLYIIYGGITCYFVWRSQPHFKLPGGGQTVSMGFFIQFVIYSILFVLVSAAETVLLVLRFRPHRKRAAAKAQAQALPGVVSQ